jgi:hypothetical protein
VAYGDLDFTPRESFYYAEATKQACVAFKKGDKTIQYSPPDRWNLSGGGSKLTLSPPQIPQAEAAMSTQPAQTGAIPATDESLKLYSDLAVRLLPREASKVVVGEAKIANIKFSNHAMADVTLTYVLFGTAFTSNYLFLPYDKELITFQISSRSADFPKLSAPFRSSLFSLQGL